MSTKKIDSVSAVSRGRYNFLNQIAFRLPVLMIGLAIVASAVVAFLGYNTSDKALTEASKSQLALVAQARRDALYEKLVRVDTDIKRLVDSNAMRIALSDLHSAIGSLEDDRPDILSYYQQAGLSRDERITLSGDGNKTVYSWRHTQVHPDFVASLKGGDYGDILLFDAEGNVIYSVVKGAEFLRNIKESAIANSVLPAQYEKAMTLQKGEVLYSDFTVYGPAGDDPSIFVSTPVFIESFGTKTRSGVIAIRLNAKFFDVVLQNRDNMGKTGQTYLTKYDGTILSNKPLANVSTSMSAKVDASVVKQVTDDLAANGNKLGFSDANNQFVLGIPLGIDQIPALIVAETSVDEALAAVNDLAWDILISGFVVIVVVAVVGIFVARSISTPLNRLSKNLSEIADGDLGVEVESARRKDEIGDIGRAVVSFQANLIRAKELDEQQGREQKEREDRVRRVEELNENFDVGVRDILTSVSDAGGNLESTAKSMATISEQTNTEAQTVSSASEQSLMNLQAVAGAAEELSATVGEIDREVRRSADTSRQAAEKASAAEVSVNGLMEAAQRIGEVVSLINDIADQTNLLALNATIEAARAGEAGKGFAVVASEVKGLANQTGQATGEISVQIQSVQAETEKAVAAIKEISEVIADVNQATTAIASAVEEQAVTATDISSNIQQVTSGSSEVAQAITRVSMIAGDAGQEAENVLSSAQQLTTQSDQLKAMVVQYLENIRAA